MRALAAGECAVALASAPSRASVPHAPTGRVGRQRLRLTGALRAASPAASSHTAFARELRARDWSSGHEIGAVGSHRRLRGSSGRVSPVQAVAKGHPRTSLHGEGTYLGLHRCTRVHVSVRSDGGGKGRLGKLGEVS